jgi:hypothetical protein
MEMNHHSNFIIKIQIRDTQLRSLRAAERASEARENEGLVATSEH